MIVISAYPIVIKPDFIKKEYGVILVFVGLIFLARGFVDLKNPITDIYDTIFVNFDLHIAIIAFLLISFVIVRILTLSKKPNNKVKSRPITRDNGVYQYAQKHFQHKSGDVSKNENEQPPKKVNVRKIRPKQPAEVKPKRNVQKNNPVNNKKSKGINKSSDKIRFESSDVIK